jgi:hypothetical protein
MAATSRLLALLLLAPAGAAAQSLECGFFPQTGAGYICTCAAGATMAPVWGSGPFTADSDICTAARHAGVLGAEGGRVTALAVEPPSAFTGTVSNGVTSLDFGTYPRAYVFEGATLALGAPPCGRLGPEPETSCACPAAGLAGAVWGSDPYTDDSDVCTAARHAGVIGDEGGTVAVRRVEGEPSYAGSTRNGITSMDYGPWEESFTFASKPTKS